MNQWRDTLRMLLACPARRIDRHLYAYIRQRLDRPESLGALAQGIFERIHPLPDLQLARSPKRRLFVIAARTLRELQAAAPETPAPRHPSVRDPLRAHLQHALAQLPAMHAAILVAHKRDQLSFIEIGERFGLSPALVATHCAQARAMISQRSNAIIVIEGADLTPAFDDTLLIAQAAAEWIQRSECANAEECNELIRWIQRSPRNVRELLLAAVWDLILLELNNMHGDESSVLRQQ